MSPHHKGKPTLAAPQLRCWAQIPLTLLALGLLASGVACPAPRDRSCRIAQMYGVAPAHTVPSWFQKNSQSYGARADARGPIGGGRGYRRLLDRSRAPVKTLDGLIAALRVAKPGSVVFVDGKATIDCTVRVLVEKLVLEIPAGVTLASDRGRSGSAGALLFSDARATSPLLRAAGPGVRVTGLRIRGPEPRPRDDHHRRAFIGGRGRSYYYRYPVTAGVFTRHGRLTVDNCELAGWSHAAVHLKAGDRHRVHHNHIHHNLFRGLGYGVVVARATALIERNLFHHNRHSIAATGVVGCGYEARHNVELGRGRSHCFDMHGGADRKDGTDVAGSWIKIHHNTFRWCPRAIAIRGVPQQRALVHHNWFSHSYSAGAVYSGGNTRVYNNAFGAVSPRIR